MNPLIEHLIENWKSTAANVLTLVVITAGYFSTMTPEQLATSGLTPREMFWIAVAGGIGKIYVALITKDAK